MYAGIRVLDGNRVVRTVSVLLAVLFVVGAACAWAADPVGRADNLTGKVSVEREGRQDALRPGDPLYLKDRIRTGADSSAEIVLADESRVKLAANTTLEITEYLYNPNEQTRQGLLSMMSGKARFAVQDLQDFRDKRFRVQTQTAVVGSRDTDFVVSSQPDVLKDAACRDGLVEAFCLENSIVAFSREFPDKPVLLTANMLSQVCGRNMPTPPRFATAAERGRLVAGVESIGRLRPAPGVKAKESKDSGDEKLKGLGPEKTGDDLTGRRGMDPRLGGPPTGIESPLGSTTTTTRPRTTTTTTRPVTTTTRPVTTTTRPPTTTTTMLPTTTTRPTLPPPPPPPNAPGRPGR